MKTLICIVGASLALAGCHSVTPQLDRQFGLAAHQAAQQQIRNPQAALAPTADGIDGKAGKSAYDNYQKSFRAPTPQTGALSIGVGR